MEKKTHHRVLFAAAEVAPFIKAGGLADVTGALPKALQDLHEDVRVVMPRYAQIDPAEWGCGDPIASVTLPFEGRNHTVHVYQTRLPHSSVRVYLLDESHFLSTGRLYFEDVPDPQEQLRRQGERFLFFSSAVLALLPVLAWWPDVIHCHDWHTGPLPFLLSQERTTNPRLKETAVVYTTHNLALQGWMAIQEFSNALGIDAQADPLLRRLQARDGGVNFAALGLLSAEIINTVSPRYAQEILSPQFGSGLEDLLQERKHDVFGVLNGIDTDVFDPSHDTRILEHYSLATLEKKHLNTVWLRHSTGIMAPGPLLGIVSRLTEQKGILLISEIAPQLVAWGIGLIILGTGEHVREQTLLHLAEQYPHSISLRLGFDPTYAQRIYAGSDGFLMPSKFEPCGLGQMISMRYGTIPIVHATGGLADTVTDKLGFIFNEFTAAALLDACQKAMTTFHNPAEWKRLQERGMRQDFSWHNSAKEYYRLYQLAYNANAKK